MKRKEQNPLRIILLLGAALTLGADPNSRKVELASALEALQWKPPPPADPDNDTSPNPGWYNRKNRQAVARFIAKYPDTEEAYLAEVWLTFAKADAERNRDIAEWKRQRAEDGEALKRIVMKTASPTTAKIAKILRACVLLDGDQTETDEQFVQFAKVTETPRSEFEPYLRRMRVISECHQGHLKEALALAEELQAKYPAWSKLELIHSDIHVLKGGESPYPTWEQLRNVGPTLEELKRRSKTK